MACIHSRGKAGGGPVMSYQQGTKKMKTDVNRGLIKVSPDSQGMRKE